jgi:hypothetical protein
MLVNALSHERMTPLNMILNVAQSNMSQDQNFYNGV